LSNWRVRGVRGATTVEENTFAAVAQSVNELLSALESSNQLDPADIVSAIFSATPDIDCSFPALAARSRPPWQHIPLLDVQQMAVPGSLERCIRVLLHVNTPLTQRQIHHVYLRRAQQLRPDLSLGLPIGVPQME